MLNCHVIRSLINDSNPFPSTFPHFINFPQFHSAWCHFAAQYNTLVTHIMRLIVCCDLCVCRPHKSKRRRRGRRHTANNVVSDYKKVIDSMEVNYISSNCGKGVAQGRDKGNGSGMSQDVCVCAVYSLAMPSSQHIHISDIPIENSNPNPNPFTKTNWARVYNFHHASV